MKLRNEVDNINEIFKGVYNTLKGNTSHLYLNS